MKQVKYVLGLDFETTGLDEKQDVVTEIGAVLWNWQTKMPMLIMNELVTLPKGKMIPDSVVDLNGITEEMIGEFGLDDFTAFKKLNEMGDVADYVMAHNAEFDKKFYISSMGKIKIRPSLVDKTWIDSVSDVEYPRNITTRKLTHIAAEHGFVNPFAHRAVFDVLTMFSVVKNYDIEDIVRNACDEKYELRAAVSFDDRQKAKDKGFYWNPQGRVWIKTIGKLKIKEEVKTCDFDVYSRKKDGAEGWKEVEKEKNDENK